MPKNNRRRGGRNRNVGDRSIRQLITSHPAAARGDVVVDSEDLSAGPMDFRLVQNPPRNFLRQIHWVQSQTRSSVTFNATGLVVEANQSFSLSSNVTDFTSFVAVFDQYCIHSAVVRIVPNFGALSTTVSTARIHTALDFDNVNNVTTENAIQQFSTCITVEATPGKAVERVVKPCMAPAVWAGGAFSGYAVARMWLNSSTATVPHYGVRILTAGASASLLCDIFVTVIVGFRNNI